MNVQNHCTTIWQNWKMHATKLQKRWLGLDRKTRNCSSDVKYITHTPHSQTPGLTVVSWLSFLIHTWRQNNKQQTHQRDFRYNRFRNVSLDSSSILRLFLLKTTTQISSDKNLPTRLKNPTNSSPTHRTFTVSVFFCYEIVTKPVLGHRHSIHKSQRAPTLEHTRTNRHTTHVTSTLSRVFASHAHTTVEWQAKFSCTTQFCWRDVKKMRCHKSFRTFSEMPLDTSVIQKYLWRTPRYLMTLDFGWYCIQIILPHAHISYAPPSIVAVLNRGPNS